MRRFLLAAMISGTVAGAQAADMPDFLRGSLQPDAAMTRVNWQGFYVGGQAAVGETDVDARGSTQGIAAGLLVNTAIEAAGDVSSWPVGGKVSVRGNGVGGFAGYNSQWDDVVVGLEFNYMHANFGGSQSSTIGRSFVDLLGYTDAVNYTGTGSIQISNMATLRARGAYVFGCFMPYAFGGLALGQADIVRTANISGYGVNAAAAPGFTYIPFNYLSTIGNYNHLIYGFSGGLGVDVMLVSGLFMRAEWEYVHFATSIDTTINTLRVGLGYKF